MAKDVFIAGFIALSPVAVKMQRQSKFTAAAGTEAVLKQFIKYPGTVMKHWPDKSPPMPRIRPNQ